MRVGWFVFLLFWFRSVFGVAQWYTQSGISCTTLAHRETKRSNDKHKNEFTINIPFTFIYTFFSASPPRSFYEGTPKTEYNTCSINFVPLWLRTFSEKCLGLIAINTVKHHKINLGFATDKQKKRKRESENVPVPLSSRLHPKQI